MATLAPDKMRKTVGGGPKKILYALETAQRMGLKNTAKALSAKNACKACAYGMGGQLGGMTNEQGEFPAVCNKSIQAQSTDIQQPIPDSVLTHSMAAFRELDGYEMEHLGRLDKPILKARGSESFRILGWDEALEYALGKLKAVEPDRSFFYASGRSSNEA
ncbi:MAG: histidine kinase, partial [Pseudomonadota bacterium]